METKEIRLFKKEGSLALQEDSALFMLSVILESYVASNSADSICEFAERLDEFIWSDNLVYFDS